jgi:hypothetical protein
MLSSIYLPLKLCRRYYVCLCRHAIIFRLKDRTNPHIWLWTKIRLFLFIIFYTGTILKFRLNSILSSIKKTKGEPGLDKIPLWFPVTYN